MGIERIEKPNVSILRFWFRRVDWRWHPLTVVRWSSVHTKMAANTLRWLRRWRSDVTGKKASNSNKNINGNVQITNLTDVKYYSAKTKTVINIVVYKHKTKMKGVWNCGRGHVEFSFWVGFRSSLPSNNLPTRQTNCRSTGASVWPIAFRRSRTYFRHLVF